MHRESFTAISKVWLSLMLLILRKLTPNTFLWISAVVNFIHIGGGGGHTKFGQNSTYAPRDSRQRCIFVLNFLQAVVMKWHKHTHIHIFLRQDQPLLGAEKTNSKKPMEVYNFCEGTTYFCRM